MDETVDLERLTAPLGDGPGVGEDLRLAVDASSFYLLKDLRADARGAEREAAGASDSDTPVIEAGARKWAELSTLAQSLLETQTKDLEIAAWLTEALARLDGFPGLATGLDLVLRLMRSFWLEGIYPSEDEDGVETRIAPIAGLLGLSGASALVQPIKLIPLSDRDRDVALWSLEAAQAPIQGADDAEARERATARRSERMDQVRQAVQRSSPAFLRQTHTAVGAALANVQALVEEVDRVAGTGPFGSQVTEPLKAILGFYEDLVGHLFSTDTRAAGGEEDQAPAAGSVASLAQGPGRIAGREEAYDAILRIADHLALAEPQSLVARSLREVVRRARLPLDELLAELLPDDEQRQLYLLRAGVKGESAPVSDGY